MAQQIVCCYFPKSSRSSKLQKQPSQCLPFLSPLRHNSLVFGLEIHRFQASSVLANPTHLPSPIWSLQAYEQDIVKVVCGLQTPFPAPQPNLSDPCLLCWPMGQYLVIYVSNPQVLGLTFQNSAHLDFVWFVQKIVSLNPLDKKPTYETFIKYTCNPKP